ncbi:hypothetical protein Pint_19857 [Pistacia integerrima]|uniref:Uncharacterized protein n=1 Tax=Pistacia integerrima TaxID=434235 RepID=A0ACC0X7W2_9ROSI|nr:hypothetical protein Pint_19857 [Pistacia integerrima]
MLYGPYWSSVLKKKKQHYWLRNMHCITKSFPSNPMPLSSPKNNLLLTPNQGDCPSPKVLSSTPLSFPGNCLCICVVKLLNKSANVVFAAV